MKFCKLLVIVIFVLLPLSVFAQDGTKKAKTIDELAKMYDSSSCKDCHADIHAEWDKSLHARSIFGVAEVGRTAATFKTTIENGFKDWPASGVKKPEDVGIRHLMVCAKCHLPQLNEAEDSVAQEIVKNLYQGAGGPGSAKSAKAEHRLPRLPSEERYRSQVEVRLS